MIALFDYGSGNLRSVEKALQQVGAQVRLVQHPDQLEGVSAAVLPGVGAFDDCINALKEQDLFQAIQDFVQSGRPFLGICVGYQGLFEKSEEFNSTARGLSIFPGTVVRFDEKHGEKIPQIGWNEVRQNGRACPLFKGIPDQSFFYFVHSYFPRPADEAIAAGWTDYGQTFVSAVWRDNVFATQFHPEKSQKVGLQLLANFVGLTKAA